MLPKLCVCSLMWAVAALSSDGQDAARAQAPTVLSIQQAVEEAVRNNPGLLAERLGIPVADAAVITARLRPNPVISTSADHLDALGTGFSDVNGAGPSEYALRVDLPWERGHKRELRIDA